MRVTVAPVAEPHGPLTYASSHQALLRARMLDGPAPGEIAAARLWLEGHPPDTYHLLTRVLGTTPPDLGTEVMHAVGQAFARHHWIVEVAPGEFEGEWALLEVHARVRPDRPLPPNGDPEGILSRSRT